ncbi:MAG: hypothetical protein ACI9VN_001949 [Patescibacteria group bacterium]|jgi:hypothetical protein
MACNAIKDVNGADNYVFSNSLTNEIVLLVSKDGKKWIADGTFRDSLQGFINSPLAAFLEYAYLGRSHIIFLYAFAMANKIDNYNNTRGPHKV